MARAVSFLRARDGAAIIGKWVKAISVRGGERSTRAATAGSARSARKRAPRNRPEGLPGTRRARRRGRGGLGRVRRSRAQDAPLRGVTRRVANRGPVPRLARAWPVGRRLFGGKHLDESRWIAPRRRDRSLLGQPLRARSRRPKGNRRSYAARRPCIHAGLDRFRDRSHLRQNGGVRTTRSVKSSSRPSSMAKLQIQVWVSVRLA